jgi:hypothetical protein
MCTLPPFIRNSLLGLMKMTSCLILHHADQILPCADFFNPGWEVEIGSGKGQITHRNVFRRKVDPIVNGITDMQKFSPVSEIKTKTPTVTMLSHVWFAKDIKTALLAADIISNEWGFKDYKLDIYGALNKAPVYSSECQEILACKGLGQSVALKGTADPAMVLADSWLFLNSSVSEGLPLALGEAALTGAPVVCTDVGASLRVLTDPDDGKRYSEVVAPNDAYGLARAQINLLAMIDEWAQYADDAPGTPAPILPPKPTAKDVEIITRRMYEKSPQRRKLGIMARDIVQKSFGGERYLREHEQMLWIGKACYEMLGLERIPPPPKHPGRMLSLKQRRQTLRADTASSNIIDPQLEKMRHPRRPQRPAHLLSTNTSFSSMYVDEPIEPPQHIYGYEDDWGPATPDSSVLYPRQEDLSASVYSEVTDWDYFAPSAPSPIRSSATKDIPRIVMPPQAYVKTQNLASTPMVSMAPPKMHSRSKGKTPIQYGYEYDHTESLRQPPTSNQTSSFGRDAKPKLHLQMPENPMANIGSRRSVLARQAVRPESTRSSVRTRSHLNEVISVEYGCVIDGRL